MRCLYLTVLIATMMVSNSFALLCGLFQTCKDVPHEGPDNKYYIGYTDEDCRNMYICKRKGSDICINEYGKAGAGAVVGGFTCSYPTLYTECYDKNGNKKSNWIDPKIVSFLSPWNDDFDDCDISYRTVNKKDSRCYLTPYSDEVLNSNMATSDAHIIFEINGRCLTKAGWCDC